jgi:hypothetical protein
MSLGDTFHAEIRGHSFSKNISGTTHEEERWETETTPLPPLGNEFPQRLHVAVVDCSDTFSVEMLLLLD